MPVQLFQAFQRETGVRILEGYGLTEGACASSSTPLDAPPRIGSIGLRFPYQDMRALILDDDNRYVRDAETDEIGVIAIRGPNVFAGYLDPAHNKGVWIERAGETWLNTGDLGRQDADGYFWLTGRKKELIIRGGHNIDPKLIEDALQSHPAVALTAAIGSPDAHAGELPVAYVQLKAGAAATEAELLEHAARSIPEKAAIPKRVKISPSLPTTAVGKLFKPALDRARDRGGHPRRSRKGRRCDRIDQGRARPAKRSSSRCREPSRRRRSQGGARSIRIRIGGDGGARPLMNVDGQTPHSQPRETPMASKSGTLEELLLGSRAQPGQELELALEVRKMAMASLLSDTADVRVAVELDPPGHPANQGQHCRPRPKSAERDDGKAPRSGSAVAAERIAREGRVGPRPMDGLTGAPVALGGRFISRAAAAVVFARVRQWRARPTHEREKRSGWNRLTR